MVAPVTLTRSRLSGVGKLGPKRGARGEGESGAEGEGARVAGALSARGEGRAVVDPDRRADRARAAQRAAVDGVGAAAGVAAVDQEFAVVDDGGAGVGQGARQRLGVGAGLDEVDRAVDPAGEVAVGSVAVERQPAAGTGGRVGRGDPAGAVEATDPAGEGVGVGAFVEVEGAGEGDVPVGIQAVAAELSQRRARGDRQVIVYDPGTEWSRVPARR